MRNFYSFIYFSFLIIILAAKKDKKDKKAWWLGSYWFWFANCKEHVGGRNE